MSSQKQLGALLPRAHLPTGIASLDALTGGGLAPGDSVHLAGPVGSSKTTLTLQAVDNLLQRGIAVAVLAADDEPEDVVTRLLQRRGGNCEDAHDQLANLPLLMLDSTSTIEQAAAGLHRFAAGRPAALVIDNVPSACCENEDVDSIDEAVIQRVAAIRAAASLHRMLVIAVSDLPVTFRFGRAVWAAIRSSADVQLGMRTVRGTSDLVELRVYENRHGQTHRRGQDGIFLRVDRDRQILVEVDSPRAVP